MVKYRCACQRRAACNVVATSLCLHCPPTWATTAHRLAHRACSNAALPRNRALPRACSAALRLPTLPRVSCLAQRTVLSVLTAARAWLRRPGAWFSPARALQALPRGCWRHPRHGAGQGHSVLGGCAEAEAGHSLHPLQRWCGPPRPGEAARCAGQPGPVAAEGHQVLLGPAAQRSVQRGGVCLLLPVRAAARLTSCCCAPRRRVPVLRDRARTCRPRT